MCSWTPVPRVTRDSTSHGRRAGAPSRRGSRRMCRVLRAPGDPQRSRPGCGGGRASVETVARGSRTPWFRDFGGNSRAEDYNLETAQRKSRPRERRRAATVTRRGRSLQGREAGRGAGPWCLRQLGEVPPSQQPGRPASSGASWSSGVRTANRERREELAVKEKGGRDAPREEGREPDRGESVWGTGSRRVWAQRDSKTGCTVTSACMGGGFP